MSLLKQLLSVTFAEQGVPYFEKYKQEDFISNAAVIFFDRSFFSFIFD